MKSTYLCKVYEDVKNRNKNEIEFLRAVYEFLDSIEGYVDKHKEIEKNGILERFVEPERFIQFRVPWVDDNNKVQVNRGYRVQFNSAIGPYKGGIRFHPSVNASIIKFLGFEQTLKNSLTGLPIGGGKGGADFDPKDKSEGEIMRFCQSFVIELSKHIGANTDVPAGDIGVGEREIGYMFGQYKRIKNEFVGAFTGKNICFGGSLGRTEATGFGLCYFTNKMLKVMRKESLKNKTIIISGSGNVALYALKKATELGAKVVAMSDSNGYIYNKNGIDFNVMKKIKEEEHKRIKEYLSYYSDTTYVEDCKKIWTINCDIALPCATQNEIDINDAKILVNNGVMAVCEGANMPCSLEASKYFIEQEILYGPSKAANAGGVLVSGFEMSQNASYTYWSFDEIDKKLQEQMESIFLTINKCAQENNNIYNTILGANIIGFEKIAKAMIFEGIV